MKKNINFLVAADNIKVSWIRHRDIHLLTVGRYTYTSDQRFRALHEEDSDDWLLKINYVQTRDSGMYECQISTTPPLSHFVRLNVVKPHTHILGGPDMHINTGSTINLTCLVEYSPEPPDFIYWNHNNKRYSLLQHSITRSIRGKRNHRVISISFWSLFCPARFFA
ncbi:hypothetical protein E2C01_049348 [Portunus trituberculatus]|uniref:Ig-like domain-containing protein n=1 Tax=Portunus trituberculatus TaxID=210409 RepID=A0A5B7GDQ1_PORTR|nr:hypothetical protein [Portunus trituberculatus]